MKMEDNVMERKFGKITLDELKKACEICGSDNKTCENGCPLSGCKVGLCRIEKHKSILELIDVYKDTRKMHQYWFTKAQELQNNATRYDSVRNELIRTQELLKNAQDECRKRADKIKSLRETIDTMDDDYNELSAKLENAEMARKSLELDIKNLNDQLERGVNIIHQLTKEKNEANEALLHYRTLMSSLRFIGEAMRGDQSGNHEKD